MPRRARRAKFMSVFMPDRPNQYDLLVKHLSRAQAAHDNLPCRGLMRNKGWPQKSSDGAGRMREQLELHEGGRPSNPPTPRLRRRRGIAGIACGSRVQNE